MHGGYPLGARSQGATPASGIGGTLAPYATQADLAIADYLLCAEIEAESDAGPATLRYASHPMPKDGIRAALDSGFAISREVTLGRRGFEGLVESSAGEVRLRLLGSGAAAAAPAAGGTVYHVAPAGDDDAAGTATAPWRTVARVNAAALLPGDVVLFARGGVWREALVPPASGTAQASIRFGAYGSGAKPRLVGCPVDLVAATWTRPSAGTHPSVWRTVAGTSPAVPEMLWLDGGNRDAAPVADIAAVNAGALGTWRHDNTTGELWVNSGATAPPARWSAIELNLSRFGVDTRTRSYLDIENLDLRHFREAVLAGADSAGLRLYRIEARDGTRDGFEINTSGGWFEECVSATNGRDGMQGCHGYHLNDGAAGNTLKNCSAFDNSEDCLQFSPDCGSGNLVEGGVFEEGYENCVDIKTGSQTFRNAKFIKTTGADDQVFKAFVDVGGAAGTQVIEDCFLKIEAITNRVLQVRDGHVIESRGTRYEGHGPAVGHTIDVVGDGTRFTSRDDVIWSAGSTAGVTAAVPVNGTGAVRIDLEGCTVHSGGQGRALRLTSVADISAGTLRLQDTILKIARSDTAAIEVQSGVQLSGSHNLIRRTGAASGNTVIAHPANVGGTPDWPDYSRGQIEDGTVAAARGWLASSTGADPMFVDEAGGNFALATGSPARAAAADGGDMGAPSTAGAAAGETAPSGYEAASRGALTLRPWEYSADGRPVRMRLGIFDRDRATGRESPPRLADCAPIFATTGGAWAGDREAVRLNTRDLGLRLKRPLQQARYGGTGGWDGDSELTDRTKPVTFGSCAHVPVQIVDTVAGLGQVHSRRVAGIGRGGTAPGDLYEAGVPWRYQGAVATPEALEAMAVAGGIAPASYVVCLANGGVALGSVPTGLVTADVDGDATEEAAFSDGTYYTDMTGNIITHWVGYVDTTCGIMLRILTAFMAWPTQLFDEAGFVRADAARSGVVGFHLAAGDETTGDEALRALAMGALLFAGPTPTGVYTVRPIEVPAVALAGRKFGRHDRDRDSVAFDAPDYGSPPHELSVLYDRNWAGELRGTQVFEAALPSVKRWLEQEHRKARGPDAATVAARKARYPTSESWEHRTFFRYRIDAEAGLDLLLALYAPGRRIWEFATAKALLSLDPGQVVLLADDAALGLDATGKPLLVFDLDDEPATRDRRTRVRAFG